MVRIGEIKPIMNFSKVRVQGVLKADTRALRDGTVLYLLADESGTLPVFLNRTPEGQLPRAGCRIRATGRLNVGAGNQVRMRVQDARQIVVEEAARASVVAGQVVDVWRSPQESNAPHKIILSTSGGSLEVVYWFAPEQQVAVGDQIEVKGFLGFYKGRKQLKVRKRSDIRRQPEG